VYPFYLLIGGTRKSYARLCNILGDRYWGLYCDFLNWGNVEFSYYGDDLPEAENAIIILNHRFWLDWLMTFLLASRKKKIRSSQSFCKRCY